MTTDKSISKLQPRRDRQTDKQTDPQNRLLNPATLQGKYKSQILGTSWCINTYGGTVPEV